MNTALRARPEVLAGGDLAAEPARVRTLVLAVATTLSLAVLSAAAARFDGWAVEPPIVTAAPARVAAAPVAVRPVGVPAIPAHDHLDALRFVGIEREELVDERKRHAVARGDIEPAVLQVDVGLLAVALEDPVLLLEVEQRPRGDRNHELSFDRVRHGEIMRHAGSGHW